MSLTPKQVVYGTVNNIYEHGSAVRLHDGSMVNISEKNVAIGTNVYVLIETVDEIVSGKILNFI
jgi:hypothetical protein